MKTNKVVTNTQQKIGQSPANKGFEVATIGGGCFWCLEAVYQKVKGVTSVVSGYSGGHIVNPAYREVCSERTGHAEVIQIEFDPTMVKYEDLLTIFWHIHDPTTLNRQGGDKGTQYRSVIFYHNDVQKQIAEASLKATDSSDLWPHPIVTEVGPLINFFAAEDYHQNYYQEHQAQPYCVFVIGPKMKKLQERFLHQLKE